MRANGKERAKGKGQAFREDMRLKIRDRRFGTYFDGGIQVNAWSVRWAVDVVLDRFNTDGKVEQL